MASLYYKDENGAYQPLSVKHLGGTGGGKTYMHFISAGIYAVSDSDIGGSCTLVVPTSSKEEICGASESKLIDFLKKIGATQEAWAYPIAMHTNGYTSVAWTGIYYDTSFEKLAVISSTASNSGSTQTVAVNMMKETVIEM
nr:MAG TPA: hypothetical protein [Caudoviricetes sp.]